MGNRLFLTLNERGQSVVEYVLLLTVVMSLIYVVVSSARFKSIIGDNGAFAVKMKGETEWNYRFALQGKGGFVGIQYPQASNPSYWNARDGVSRFIGPLQKYPAP